MGPSPVVLDPGVESPRDLLYCGDLFRGKRLHELFVSHHACGLVRNACPGVRGHEALELGAECAEKPLDWLGPGLVWPCKVCLDAKASVESAKALFSEDLGLECLSIVKKHVLWNLPQLEDCSPEAVVYGIDVLSGHDGVTAHVPACPVHPEHQGGPAGSSGKGVYHLEVHLVAVCNQAVAHLEKAGVTLEKGQDLVLERLLSVPCKGPDICVGALEILYESSERGGGGGGLCALPLYDPLCVVDCGSYLDALLLQKEL